MEGIKQIIKRNIKTQIRDGGNDISPPARLSSERVTRIEKHGVRAALLGI